MVKLLGCSARVAEAMVRLEACCHLLQSLMQAVDTPRVCMHAAIMTICNSTHVTDVTCMCTCMRVSADAERHMS